MEQDIKVKSLKKALDLLECFSTKTPELGVTELSERLGLYKSNVHNIISTFERCGYIEKNPDNNKYRLGMKILELSYIINANLGLHKIIHPFISALSNEVNEVVYFAIPKDPLILYLEGVYPSFSYSARSMVGETAEMYCTSLGKAILAHYPEERRKKVIEQQSMREFTPTTITDRSMLEKELAHIRQTGYSIDNMEHEFGIKCVGMPVFRMDGTLLGAVSISGPSLRFEEEAVERYIGLLRACVYNISQRV